MSLRLADPPKPTRLGKRWDESILYCVPNARVACIPVWTTTTWTGQRQTYTKTFQVWSTSTIGDRGGPPPVPSSTAEPTLPTPVILNQPAPTSHDSAELITLQNLASSLTQQLSIAVMSDWRGQQQQIKDWGNRVQESLEDVAEWLQTHHNEPPTSSRPPPSSSTTTTTTTPPPSTVYSTRYTTTTSSFTSSSTTTTTTSESDTTTSFPSFTQSDQPDTAAIGFDSASDLAASGFSLPPSNQNTRSFSISSVNLGGKSASTSNEAAQIGMSKTTTIIIAASAAGAGLVLIALVWFCCRRSRKASKQQDYFDTVSDEYKPYSDYRPTSYTGSGSVYDDPVHDDMVTSYSAPASSFANQTRQVGRPAVSDYNTTQHTPASDVGRSDFTPRAPPTTYAPTTAYGAQSQVTSVRPDPVTFRPQRAPPSTRAARTVIDSNQGDFVSMGRATTRGAPTTVAASTRGALTLVAGSQAPASSVGHP